ncbi:MAG: hypothetical protein EBZ49_00020 [Proteobacteria bacterium]|nr:hypothetical protein [Pseudomonadota bacterium]
MKYLMALLIGTFALSPEYQKGYEEIHGTGKYTRAQLEEAEPKIRMAEQNLQTLEDVAIQSNLALRTIFSVAVKNLHRKGYTRTAREIESGWEERDGEIVRLAYRGERNIGDFEPLSKWLADAYDKIESKLGYQLCLALRLSDIKTINFGLVVVFRPCKYGEEEFKKHFIHDEKYRGLAPVVAYWTTIVACSFGTYGIGYFFICSPIGMIVELGVDKKIAPYLAPKIYNLACEE